jgi:hypothetical protein
MTMVEEQKPTPHGDTGATGPPKPNIHEAELASGPSGGVYRGAEIDFDQAVASRKNGQDVVVCGDELKANRSLAERIEAAVGPYVRSPPHRQYAGPRALPHFQQQDPEHEGHTFYETPKQKAMRRKP